MDSVQPMKYKYGSRKIDNSTKMNSEIIIRSKELKNPELGDKVFNFCKKPGVSNSQI